MSSSGTPHAKTAEEWFAAKNKTCVKKECDEEKKKPGYQKSDHLKVYQVVKSHLFKSLLEEKCNEYEEKAKK